MPQANVHIGEMHLISNVIPGIRCIVALIAAHCLFSLVTRECMGLHVWVWRLRDVSITSFTRCVSIPVNNTVIKSGPASWLVVHCWTVGESVDP